MAVTNQIEVFVAEYRGPSQEELDKARAVLNEEKEARISVEVRSALQCNECHAISPCGLWTQIGVWETSYGPYEREKYHSHTLLKCPCGHEERLGWATLIDPLLKHMKKERRDD